MFGRIVSIIVVLIVIAVGATLLLRPDTASGSCLGAAALAPGSDCAKFSLTFSPSSSAALGVEKGVARNKNLCRGGLINANGVIGVCRLGATKPRRSWALIGDSHAAQWRPSLAAIAKRHGLRIYSLTASACDFNLLNRFRAAGQKRADCTRFRRAVPGFLRTHPEIDTVIFTHVDRRETGGAASYIQAWQQLPPTVKRIVALRDNPRTLSDLHGCLAQARRQGRAPGRACSASRQVAIQPSNAGLAAQQLGQIFIDLSDYFCDQQRCYPVIGRLLVYGDGNHQTRQFNRTLAPYLEQKLAPLLAGAN